MKGIRETARVWEREEEGWRVGRKRERERSEKWNKIEKDRYIYIERERERDNEARIWWSRKKCK